MAAVGQPLESVSGRGCVYMDYNGTTPLYPEATAAMQRALEQGMFGNPSSSHFYGREAKAAVDLARKQTAGAINCTPQELFFTSCGTESDNWIIYGAVAAARDRWGLTPRAPGAPPPPVVGRVPHVVCSNIEHIAVTAHLTHLEQQGLLRFTQVPAASDGTISAADVVAAITGDTVLVTIMHSNNEIGSLQPVRAVAAAVKSLNPGILVHTDAAQSIGKVEVDVRALGVDALTLVGHKFGAPKGVAALYIKAGTPPFPNLLHGGGQELGRRAGTENVLLVVAIGAAAAVVQQETPLVSAHMARMRGVMERGLLAALPEDRVRVNGPTSPDLRLPNTLSISIEGFVASDALRALADRLAASAGAACHSSGGASGVLRAIGLEDKFALGTLRLSAGRHTTVEEAEAAVELVLGEVRAQGLL